MTFLSVSLDDKYTLESGRIFLSGTQALVRLPMMQRQRDRAAALNTAGFISGYRGSPLGAYDRELWRAQAFLDSHDIRFQPGVNEDLAATAIWGTQQVGLFPGARRDGVFSIWYGKGPGVDRSGDVFKHANLAGTSRYGGVIAAFGDDHGAKSSTLAHQSEQAMAAAMIPVLNPSTIDDILAFGLYGWAMSRFAGTWVGLKCVDDLVESSATVDLDRLNVVIAQPQDVTIPPDGVHVRMGHIPLEAEQRLVSYKLPLAVAFARANGLDKVIFSGPRKWLGIVTAGKAYLDVRQALGRLGIGEAEAETLGIGLYKLGLTWPVEPEGLKSFAHGFDELLFVEEKRSLIEEQAARILYGEVKPPRIVGKTDEEGKPLLPSYGILNPEIVAEAIASRLDYLGVTEGWLRTRIGRNTGERVEALARKTASIARLPYFCSGCPHNTSTKVPDGSQAMAGIGCSYMAVWMDRHTVTSTQMGGEGANWNGIAPFTDMPHVFQNIGDGTYYHSGLMAIRAAVASDVNITYKILFNDAIAMTGGQQVEGPLSVPIITRQVRDEGVETIVVVTNEPEKYEGVKDLADGVAVYHRRELDAVQRRLRETPGVTALIYDQTCAAEKRRGRKRGKYPDPAKRVFINAAVCEGCGDCSVKSNCVSVQPLETEFGRKRQIDQSSCNKDFSCLNGFCPSFVSVHGGALRKPRPMEQEGHIFSSLPDPVSPSLDTPYSVLITGIGGTGVVTIGALLSMAAHLEGKDCSVFDMTGLAQKNGGVLSHLRIARTSGQIQSVRIGEGEADLILGCDMVMAGSAEVLKTIEPDRSRAIINSHMVPTGAFQTDPQMDLCTDAFLDTIAEAAGHDRADFIDGTHLATGIMGDSIATNLFLVGYAFQAGALPISAAAIEQAIEINGVAIDANKQAFRWGRLAAEDRERVTALVGGQSEPDGSATDIGLTDKVDRRAAFLTDYQNAGYARRYRTFIDKLRVAEKQVVGERTELSNAVAESLFKLMAYKDEYEVARLYTSGDFERKLRAEFEGDFRIHFHLAPPLLTRRDPSTGEPRKMEFGPWIMTAFKILSHLRGLRGSLLDPFGYTEERKRDRQMIQDFETTVDRLLGELTTDNYALAVEIATLPQEIRGFGHVKARNWVITKDREQQLCQMYFQEDASN